MGKAQNHLKFKSNGIDYVVFYANLSDFLDPAKEAGMITVDIVGRAEINIWLNKISAQVIVKDYVVHKPESSFGF